ncbi:tetratricopeptide repeat protein 27 [Onthophagus taurus]|uniref:tetratricopeptide repeat protein 27 n=1 Tax=Onthophagus taurus TaxID=166361 RepID=UPI000C204AF2|nr:tetratricopeptide repeat protein 27 [Onthophagus taurus]
MERLSVEEKNEQILAVLLVDFDNCDAVEEDSEYIEMVYPTLPVWKVLIKNNESWDELIKCNFDESIVKEEIIKLPKEQIRTFFTFGVGCLLGFVQANFTGPDLLPEIVDYLKDPKFEGYDFAKMLAVNNEEININVKYPCLLVAARIMFQHCQVMRPMLNLWWMWRVLIIHQLVLDEPSTTILHTAEQMQKEIQNLELASHHRIKFEVEQAQLYLIYRNFSKAEMHLNIACDVAGLKYQLVGKLGKRTKHQQEDIAQIALKMELESRDNIEREPVLKLPVPKDVYLDDDVRLDQVQYAEGMETPMLPNTEQKLVLALIHKMSICKPQDELFYEEIKPFIDVILNQNNTWAVRTAALLMRAKIESKHKRTVERSLMQLEEIMICIRKNDPHPMTRVGGVYGTAMPPIWKTEAHHAELMLNLGMVKGALEVYTRLRLWEEVIVCYTIMNARHKAAEIIRQELDKAPTVKLWCLLGDATDDVTCYERAWALSRKRSHRVQRHWGMFLYGKKQYQECIPHFEKSVSINPLQPKVWLRLGYAALEVENWQVAATAYRRYVTQEPDSFEAWNNLAQVYIKLGNKRAAHHALIDALRCNFENWKVWENLLVVSADINHFKDIIRTYHQLLDLKEKYLNTEVLGVLVYGVCKNANDHEGKPCGHLMQRTRELLGRVTALYPADGFLWELYANLSPVLYLRAQRLQRAYRGYTSQSNWDKSSSRCQQVLYVLHNLAEVTLNEEIDPKDTLVHSVRLTMSSSLTIIKKHNYTDVKTLMTEVAGLLAKVIEKAKLGSISKGEPQKPAESSTSSSTTSTPTSTSSSSSS